MVHRRMLNEDQISQLFDPPIDRRAMIRHYTLSSVDLALIRRGRGDHHRLGYALMLCYLRHPGRPLRAGEPPPAELVSFVADQINVFPSEFEQYSEPNRQRHSVSLQGILRLRPFEIRHGNSLSKWLLPQAIGNDRLFDLAAATVEECRRRGIIIPAPATLERICREVRHKARREIQRRLTAGLSAEQRHGLDALTERRLETNQSWFAWLNRPGFTGG